MTKFTNPLDRLHVAAPCKADWDQMTGDDRVRFCGRCQKNVFNLSNMSRKEAERIIVNREGGLCVRFYQRADGTVITSNCPVGLAQLKRKVSRITTALISASLSFISGMGVYAGLTSRDVDQAGIKPVPLVRHEPVVDIKGLKPVNGRFTMMGGLALPYIR